MVKAALVGLLTALLAISSGNLAVAQSISAGGTVSPAGTKVTAATTTTTGVVPKTVKATTTTTTKGATTAKTSTATGTAKPTVAPVNKTLTKAKSTAGTTATTAGTTTTGGAAATPKKSLKKSSSTNTRVTPLELPSNGEKQWVGPRVNAPTGKACYRKTHRASATCATGYALDKFKTACWAECPLEYPIQCGMQCIPQNKDCTVATIEKITPVANAALSTATLGVFGQLTKSIKVAAVTVRCGKPLFEIIAKAAQYADEIQEKQPTTTTEKLLTALLKSDIAVIDLPLAVATCLDLPVASAFSTAKKVVGPIKTAVEKIIEQVAKMRSKALEPKQFVSIATSAGVTAISKMKAKDVDQLDKDLSCGGALKRIVDKVADKVKELKGESPNAPVEAIRLEISNSMLVLADIPRATKDCVPSGTKDYYEVRDQVRKAFQAIVDEVIDSSSEPTSTAKDAPVKPRSKRDYALTIAGYGLDAIALLDPTGFAALAREYIQKICGPTEFFGEVDDGELKDSLGLNTIGKAFETSNGAYHKKGDGLVKINFISSDTEDVDVNIFSAGKLIDTVKLEANKVVTWTKPMKDLQDKTLYLDRWRPGFLKIPGTGGGSLVMWIPHSSQGGHVELHALLNVS